jgi:hypothetical protein
MVEQGVHFCILIPGRGVERNNRSSTFLKGAEPFSFTDSCNAPTGLRVVCEYDSVIGPIARKLFGRE